MRSQKIGVNELFVIIKIKYNTFYFINLLLTNKNFVLRFLTTSLDKSVTIIMVWRS